MHTEDEKLAFLQSFLDDEGVQLAADAVKRNLGLRQIAKLLLNSSWGKLGQRSDRSEVVYTTNPEDFHKYFDSGEYDVLDMVHINPHLDRLVVRRLKCLDAKTPPTNNLTLAIYVTSHARIRLFHFIEQAVQRGLTILYCDTGVLLYFVLYF